MKNILFISYSRYVIMIAYFIKKIYHPQDRCILMLSDSMLREDGIAEYIRKFHIWDEIILLREKDNNLLYWEIDDFILKNRIDTFYFGHVCRKAVHYFVHALPSKTIINMMDEGGSSIDILSTYNCCMPIVSNADWYELEFEKISNYYVLYPEVSVPFNNVSMVGIDLGALKNNIRTWLNELNLMFGYTSEQVSERFLIIHNDLGEQDVISYGYETYCIDHIMEMLTCTECVVKSKPSMSMETVISRYGCRCLGNSMVPFEIVYLNLYYEQQLPPFIIAFPSSSVWNIALFTELVGINGTKVILLENIISKWYLGDARNAFLENAKKFNKLFASDKFVAPKTWGDLCELVCQRMENGKTEQEWIVQNYFDEYITRKQYRELLRVERAKKKFLMKWCGVENIHEYLEKYFKKFNMHEIVFFGIGEIAEILYSVLTKIEWISIAYCIVSEKKDAENYHGIKVIEADSLGDMGEGKYPIIITSVGYEREIKCKLAKCVGKNPIIFVSDILH